MRGQYERLREAHGFRVLDYSVDADTASPRACFQFSEDLPVRTDFFRLMMLDRLSSPASGPNNTALDSSSGALVLKTDGYGPLIELGIWSLSADSHFRP